VVEEKKAFFVLTNPRREEVALDVGCGTGFISIGMVRKGAKVYGLDVSPKMVEKLKEKIRDGGVTNIVEVRVCSMEKLPYKSGLFDVVTCCGVMDFYPIDLTKKCLIEMKRVLKNDGRIVVNFPNEKGDFIEEYVEADPMLHLYPEKSLRKMIKSCGLKIVDVKRVGMGLQFLLKKRGIKRNM
jgi:ubiquinone/menaquinone biosynthesis C-methylase UbiE